MKGSGNDNEASFMAVCNPITRKKLLGILSLWGRQDPEDDKALPQP